MQQTISQTVFLSSSVHFTQCEKSLNCWLASEVQYSVSKAIPFCHKLCFDISRSCCANTVTICK